MFGRILTLAFAGTLCILTLGGCGTGTGGEAKGLFDPESSEKLLIGVWCPPPAGEDAAETDRRYEELAAAGFNMAWNVPVAALDACEKYGIGGLVHIAVVSRDEENNTQAALEFIKDIKDHPGLLGFDITDEPSASWFEKIGEVRRLADAELTGGRYAICNLFPNYANSTQLSGEAPDAEDFEDLQEWYAINKVNYFQHVDRYMAVVRPKVLSFDYYPLYDDNTEAAGFFSNMRIISDAAKRYGVPFHGFLQAIGWSAHRTPTIDEYRWLAHSHFVFGAKQLSYFYYRAPYVEGGPEGFISALVDYDGNKTELYDNAKTVNAELAAMSPAFMAFDHRTFMTSGFDEFDLEQMGIGDAVPVFGGVSVSSEDKIVAGCFEKGDLNGFYVMNYSFEQGAAGVLSLGRERRYEIWDGTGLAKSGSADTLEIELKAGQAVFVVVE